MFALHPIFLLSLISTLFTLIAAQRPSADFLPAPIEPGTGRVGIVNRNIGEAAPKVVFWIWGLLSSTEHLEYEFRTVDGKAEFRLINWYGMSEVNKEGSPMQWGKTDFVAQWGWGEANQTTAKCHLEGKPAAEGQKQDNKLFSFLPGGKDGSYLWPCGYQDWVVMVCEDPVATCTPGGW